MKRTFEIVLFHNERSPTFVNCSAKLTPRHDSVPCFHVGLELLFSPSLNRRGHKNVRDRETCQ